MAAKTSAAESTLDEWLDGRCIFIARFHGVDMPACRKKVCSGWELQFTRRTIDGTTLWRGPFMKHTEHFTELEQEQLDWISRFADRLRLDDIRFAQDMHGLDANEIALRAWEQAAWRAMSPEDAAKRWLRERGVQ